MPQASDEARAEWDGPDDRKAMRYLKEAGYVLTSRWEWLRPRERSDQEPTEKEISAVRFLIDEWDFGGIVGWGS
jgi:hypothetical protein